MASEGRWTDNYVCVVMELEGEAMRAVARMLGEGDMVDQPWTES